jgi:hypothetical protein
MALTLKEKAKIIDMHYDKLMSHSEIMKHFNNKISYAEIKTVIDKYRNNYPVRLTTDKKAEYFDEVIRVLKIDINEPPKYNENPILEYIERIKNKE